MPVTLGEDTHHTFSNENEPLSDGLIGQFILPLESEPADEFTEYVPCFAIDCDEPYIALVWWKAQLLNYEYWLATFTEKGQLIDRRAVAYTKVVAGKIRRAVATIDEELAIVVAKGEAEEQDEFSASDSEFTQIEIRPDGSIG